MLFEPTKQLDLSSLKKCPYCPLRVESGDPHLPAKEHNEVGLDGGVNFVSDFLLDGSQICAQSC